ncbi:MAG TPA: HEAT repeat domain-containing protein, partial [Kofleriaceae bacterium]|nr:HEAT repeat domain-containing protein [Kofleriaceae bacterium]
MLVLLLTLAACASRNKQSVALYEKGDYAGAARAAEEGLAAHPKDEGLWQMRIRAALAQGDRDGIAKAYAGYHDAIRADDRDLLRELAIATIEQALASPSVKMKVAAIQAVEANELHALADVVAERMEDNDDRVAGAAAIAILRGYQQAPELASQLLRSEDAEARRIVIEGIGKKVGKLAAADLQAAASDPDPRVRRAAIRWLGQLKITAAAAVLARRLKDPDEGVRAAAASSLARLGTGDLPAFAKRALEDRALAVRLAGVELLAAAKRTDDLVRLAETDADPLVAAEAAISVKRADLAARALDRALADDRWAMRAGAANVAVRAVGTVAGVASASTTTAVAAVRSPWCASTRAPARRTASSLSAVSRRASATPASLPTARTARFAAPVTCRRSPNAPSRTAPPIAGSGDLGGSSTCNAVTSRVYLGV